VLVLPSGIIANYVSNLHIRARERGRSRLTAAKINSIARDVRRSARRGHVRDCVSRK
jgi:hypothetical protein